MRGMPAMVPRPTFVPMTRKLAPLAAAATLAFAASASAQDLFNVTVSSPTAGDLTASGSSLFDLAEDIFERQDEFERFDGQVFTATLDYAEIESALIVDGDLDGETVRVRIPSIGFDRTFDDPDEAEDFLRNNGADVVADFIRVVNEESVIGVTDGNPAALTALLADDATRLFGEWRNPFVDYTQGGDATRLFVSGSSISTDAGDGYLVEGALGTSFKFTDHVGLTLSVPVGYRDIEGSETFYFGGQIGLPIKLTPETTSEQPIMWQITPYALAAGGGSQDQLSGGIILGGGIVNLVGLQLGDFSLYSGQQATAYGGTPIEVGDYRFETDLGQTLVRANVGATYGGRGDNSAYLTGGIAYTQFLDDAAVDNYYSPFAGVGLNFWGGSLLRLGYRGDFGDGFDAHAGEIELRFAY